MENQQEQKNQSQPLTQASGSHKIQVTAEIGEPVKVQKQEKAENLKPDGEEQPKKSKRSKKTIEQEIAELDAKRERLMEKKRRQDAHEKIIFGTTIIAILKEMKGKSDRDYSIIYNSLLKYVDKNSIRDKEIFKKILSTI